MAQAAAGTGASSKKPSTAASGARQSNASKKMVRDKDPL